ncbi:radical SAM/SPASM domain-containing protein [Enterococcus cecorum]|uniref:Radical SAM core domain-containing protein n=1 Tax=Enterococcus cecorum TaxID=44008 RepID=A0A366SGX4_9ENTE|nr:radical SAM protein [Enterococcus cecorum]RBR28915.1 hypothetical protein EB18_01532 [Enterococcus cecorum]
MKKNYLEISSKITNNFDFYYYVYSRIKANNVEKTVAPLKIGLKITDNCKFRCSYCFVNKKNHNLSLQSLKRIISKLPQLPLEVYLTGGEPTLHPEFSNIVDYLYEQNILIRLHTTGFIDSHNEEYILKNLNKFNSIQLSIDSIKHFDKLRPHKSEINVLEKIAYFIEKCISCNFSNLSVNTVVSKKNILELADILNFCITNNVYKVRLSPIFTKNSHLLYKDDEYDSYFYDLISNYTDKGIEFLSDPFCHPWSYAVKHDINNYSSPLFCPAQKTELEIDPNGNVYPCPFLHNEKHLMGNILTDDFDNIWASGVESLERLEWSKRKKCINCSQYKDCGGGCYALAYITNKDYDIRCSL